MVSAGLVEDPRSMLSHINTLLEMLLGVKTEAPKKEEVKPDESKKEDETIIINPDDIKKD